MSGFLIRLTIFFPICSLVVFVCFLLQFGLSLWLMIAAFVAFSAVVIVIANALLGPLLSWHARERMRAQARSQPSHPRW